MEKMLGKISTFIILFYYFEKQSTKIKNVSQQTFSFTSSPFTTSRREEMAHNKLTTSFDQL